MRIDQQREAIAKAARLVNGVVNTLDEPAFSLVQRAADGLEDAWMQWVATDPKILRTWLKVAVDNLTEALKRLEGKLGFAECFPNCFCSPTVLRHPLARDSMR